MHTTSVAILYVELNAVLSRVQDDGVHGSDLGFVLQPTPRMPISMKRDKESRRSFFDKGLCCLMSSMASLKDFYCNFLKR